MKKILFIARQSLTALILLQLINLSICSEPYWEYYNYSSQENKFDPTETVVEWVVEWRKGNQDAFSYTGALDMKGLNKNFSWHIDPCHAFPLLTATPTRAVADAPENTNDKPSPAEVDIISPPPELLHTI